MDLNLNVPAVDARTFGTRSVGSAAAPAQAVSTTGTDVQGGHSQSPDQAVGSLNDFMKVSHRDLNFSVDSDTGIQVVKVVASDTGEVIRQIPSEVALKLAQSLKDGNTSLFDGWA